MSKYRLMDQHELLIALKDLALELGITPTRREFCNKVAHGYSFEQHFGSWSAFIHASGLAPRKMKKIDNSIFNRNIESHLDSYKPEPLTPQAPYPTIGVISDVHFPFECPRVLESFHAFLKAHPSEYVIANGDMADLYSFSRFPRSHNIFTPREELELARRKNEEFWREVKKVAPNAKCIQMLGNHCVRPMKQVLEHFPVGEDWILEGLKRHFTFDGVQTVMDPREEFTIADIIIHHGFRTKLGDHRDFLLQNSIVGHTHKGGSVYRHIRGKTLWELNSGYAGDPQSKGLSYTPQKITDWTQGFGYVWPWGPQFIPA